MHAVIGALAVPTENSRRRKIMVFNLQCNGQRKPVVHLKQAIRESRLSFRQTNFCDLRR